MYATCFTLLTGAQMDQLINEVVVIDVEPLYVYLGRLVEFSEKTITLKDADVHDLRDSMTTRERYVLDARHDGVTPNRKLVYIRQDQIISISALQDVVE